MGLRHKPRQNLSFEKGFGIQRTLYGEKLCFSQGRDRSNRIGKGFPYQKRWESLFISCEGSEPPCVILNGGRSPQSKDLERMENGIQNRRFFGSGGSDYLMEKVLVTFLLLKLISSETSTSMSVVVSFNV